MSAVIRIKRHITEEPQEAFVLNCKKRKTENSSENQTNSNETSTVLKFAGTVHQDTNINEHLAKLTKDEAKDIVTRRKPAESRLQSRRDENRQKSQQNRFKIVNFTRGNNELDVENATETPLTIVDVEKDQIVPETSANSSAQQGSSSSFSDIPDDPYVYDIYIAENSNALHQDSIDMNDLSILEFNDYLYSRPRLTNSDDESDDNDEDEDSNDENNWRNDYPDEEMSEGEGSIGEREMRRAMDDLEVGYDLSSDEDNNENGFVYSIDSEGINFEDDLDYGDVNRYGEAYARYKRRVIKDLDDVEHDSHDDDDDYPNSD